MIEIATIPYGELMTGFAGFGAAWFYIRQKMSAQKLELTKYQAETELIVMIQTSLNDANAKIKELNSDMDTIRKQMNEKDVAFNNLNIQNFELTKAKELLESRCEILNNMLSRLSNAIDETTTSIDSAIQE